ncbi:CobW family GTP-binding protein [Gorillibacterium sp. sgz5001074]|uniref:CobW family GTP-binding protein n=1 Tax=Gorillibacterium sp. sgz5001074 TaxID=3446695 RepID=UPI003F67ECD2
MGKIPVVILTGFLGSGKTTLLLKLLAEASARGLQAGVLMNELGRRDVDGLTLQEKMPGLALEKLFDGCICCDRKEDVADCMLRLMAGSPDVILMELTGVADPAEIAECLTEPKLKERVRLETVITVLDAEHVLEYNSIFSSDRALVRTLRSQVELADIVLVNKTDLVKEAKLRKVTDTVRKLNGRSELHLTTNCDFPFHTLLSAWKPLDRRDGSVISGGPRFRIVRQGEASAATATASPAAEAKSYSRLVTLELPGGKPLDRRTVEAYLASWKPRLLRAKGYLQLQSHQPDDRVSLHYAGGRVQWAASEYAGAPFLVLIGLELDPETVLARWKELS